MRARGLLVCAITCLAVSELRSTEPPTIDVFAGYAWRPYFWGPCAGIGYPLTRPYDPTLYGYPYGPYWGYGVRYRITPKHHLFPSQEEPQPIFPGTAPTELLSTESKTPWDQTVTTFLTDSTPPSPAKSNAPPRQAVSPK